MGTLRKTRAVISILDKFDQSTGAISGVDLIEGLKEEMNKTTVYRVLDRLKSHGILHSFMGQGGVKWYAKCHGHAPDSSTTAHPHFQCRECGKVECLDIEITVPALPNCKVDSAEFLIIGSCEECVSCE